MAKQIDAVIADGIRITDHVSGTVIRQGQVVGFSESLRDGRAAHGTITADGSVDHGFTGPSPTNETGTLDACQRLVRHLNAEGRQWTLPTALTEGLPHVDCRVESTADVCLDIQVVRAMTDETHWHEVSLKGGRQVVGEATEEGAHALKRSVECKQNKIPLVERAGLVLVLDANDTPALAFGPVVAKFHAVHGAWARSVGFQAIWLVGPMIGMVHRLA
jgi:hypothetical protein